MHSPERRTNEKKRCIRDKSSKSLIMYIVRHNNSPQRMDAMVISRQFFSALMIFLLAVQIAVPCRWCTSAHQHCSRRDDSAPCRCCHDSLIEQAHFDSVGSPRHDGRSTRECPFCDQIADTTTSLQANRTGAESNLNVSTCADHISIFEVPPVGSLFKTDTEIFLKSGSRQLGMRIQV